MSTISVRVKFWGPAKELTGVRGEDMAFNLASDLTLGFLRRHVFESFPRLTPYGSSLRFAVNDEFALDDRKLVDGDVVSVIPPVSGG